MRLIDADALIGELHTTFLYDDNARKVIYRKIEEAPTIGGWINVKDRPPENGQLVVVRHEVKGRIYSEVAHYIMGLWWLDWDSNGVELNAINWTPLSEPEKVNKDD